MFGSPFFMNIKIRNTTLEDAQAIQRLYQAITLFPDGIIRTHDEITIEYVEDLIQKCTTKGLALVATLDDKLIGEIHAYTPEVYAFQHLLSDLTIMVDPVHHDQGVGSLLFNNFLELIKKELQHILRVELFVREHNEKNVSFYKKLGFQVEGRYENRIFAASEKFQTPLSMVWLNPNFKRPQFQG